MAKSRLCRVCRDFHDLERPWPEACVAHFGQPADAGFHVISDSIAPFRSMADGKMYDSKSQYRRELKARGCVELGSDQVKFTPTPLPPVRDALRQVWNQYRG